MGIFSYFVSISQAMLQISILGLVGFALASKKAISAEGINGLNSFLIGVTLPALIFWQIVARFSFRAYPDWWVFVCLSLIITSFGLLLGYLLGFTMQDAQAKREFICLVGFQNSGYLPLALFGWIIPKEQLGVALIYLFLFLLGFNLVIWSWGVHFLSAHKLKSFSSPGLFSPPVMAMLFGFILVIFRINMIIPRFVLSPLETLGNCSFPLAIVMLGANLAELGVSAKTPDRKPIIILILAKLIFMPLFGLVILYYLRPPYLVGLLVVLELAMPSATSLAVIVRRYAYKEKMISQGIFISHLVSLITLPVSLSLFNWVVFRR